MAFYYQELSEKIIGVMFETYNQEGYGFREKYYEDVAAEKLKESNVGFHKQKLVKLVSKTGRGHYRKVDFDIEDKMVVELKVAKKFVKEHFDQVNEYLKALDYRLGLLVVFTPEKVLIRRVVNEK
jgi:GxxExxY protein